MTHPPPPSPRVDPARLAGFIDHTLLRPDASPADVRTLCRQAIDHGFHAVCVNPANVGEAAAFLRGSAVTVCSVAGFPLGATLAEIKAAEARAAIRDGAGEIDMVLNIGALKSGDEAAVVADVAGVMEACREGGALGKVIIETALLSDEEKVRACRLCVRARADFVKTSTGFGGGGATVEDVALMYRTVAPDGVRVKASGGIRNLSDALGMIEAGAARIGTSSGIRILEEARAALSAGGA